MPTCEPDCFWQWSLQHYESPSVSEACLRLQDEYALNVNMLLLCEYLQQHGVSLASDQVSTLVQAIEASDSALKVHRKKRRQAKAGDPTRYAALLKHELALEREQQSLLVDAFNSLDGFSDNGISNTECYVQQSVLEGEHSPTLKALLHALEATA